MAQELHDQYGFSYDHLKPLLGGWDSWLAHHNQDATAYPVETGNK